ncbi:GNAT family N-acetyltransferase [Candidatus Bipolaricaulota bacterium]|nr:GNAT family N-acetyltransferase [Candidatus Bipolaricaulota bacterium]
MIHTMPDGFTVRSASMDDVERVSEFWNDRLQATRGVRSSTPDQVRKLWNHPKFDLATDSLLVFTPQGALAGYAHVRDVKDPPVDVFTAHSVHPDFDQETWLWDALFAWTDAESRRVIPRAPAEAKIVLVAGTADEDTTKQSQLESHGFEYSRSFHRMQIDFAEPDSTPAQEARSFPEGITIRTVVPGKDDQELVAAYREAFADHYGHLEQPFEADLKEWRHWMSEDDFDPALWFLAVEHGKIVAFCTCYAEAPGDSDHGLIDELGVRPAARRRGIGQTLLLHAFDALQQRICGWNPAPV